MQLRQYEKMESCKCWAWNWSLLFRRLIYNWSDSKPFNNTRKESSPGLDITLLIAIYKQKQLIAQHWVPNLVHNRSIMVSWTGTWHHQQRKVVDWFLLIVVGRGWIVQWNAYIDSSRNYATGVINIRFILHHNQHSPAHTLEEIMVVPIRRSCMKIRSVAVTAEIFWKLATAQLHCCPQLSGVDNMTLNTRWKRR
jgi:hypothetical protein